MALSLQLGYPSVPLSITNPDVSRQDAIDIGYPMAFLEFIKIIKISFEPEVLQKYYNFYVKTWNSQTLAKPADDQALITERYRDFTRELTLNYTNLEEKQFLSRIDFNDPLDLDIALGFYSTKLKELTQYYNNKRNDIKFNTIRNKLRGTNFGTERTIEELVLSYLKTLEDGKILFDWDTIKSNISIEIEEMYNTYPSNFNQIPNDKIYDNKDLDYGENIFLRTNTDLISSIFVGMSQQLQDIKEVDQLFDNKRLLTEKYMSTDFYYLSTGATTSDILSGKLFSNVNSSENFLNRSYPTTASTEHYEYLQTPRERGFFRPSNTTIVLVDGINNTFTINHDNLSPNSLYFFPDPKIIGENGEIFTFIVDDSYLKRNMSSGNANKQPTSSQYDTKYYGYVSKIEPNTRKGLDSIFDLGYIKDFKRDISGNLYGLFTSDGKYQQNLTSTTTPPQTSVLFNGYQFYDDIYGQGLSFDYLTTYSCSACTNTITSGLSTFTGGFTNINPDLFLYFGNFTGNKDLAAPTEDRLIRKYKILEGGYIMNGSLSYADPVSSDLSAFEFSTLPFYYNELIECGLNSSSPVQRALLDSLHPTLTASLLPNLREPAMNVIDGGWFSESLPTYVINPTSYYYDNTVTTPSQLTSNNIPDLFGQLLVKNVSTKEVLPVLEAIPYLNTTHLSSVVTQLGDRINKFDTTSDLLLMETDNWFTIDKILMANGSFINPKTFTYELAHTSNNFDKISNRLKVKDQIYFSKFTLASPISSNDFVLYPNIYKYDMGNNTSDVLFPVGSVDTSFFSVSGGDIRYITADAPIITYNSQTNTFILSIMLRDQNDMVVIHDYSFYLNPNIIFSSHTITKPSSDDVSNIFGSEDLTYFLSSSAIITSQEELIL